ncbi:hypothetical protein ILYODFUR_001545 [Ilyodon furcidens]|uniref:Uncharacterized protein n=1 Tax=Ilyodon furcidens TaxID=33524 RepID=A0ABV0SHN3_9TELE
MDYQISNQAAHGNSGGPAETDSLVHQSSSGLLDFSNGLPTFSPPCPTGFLIFQMRFYQQMLSTCIPCLKLPLRADSHTGSLCNETIQPLSMFSTPHYSNYF